jgi:hypothetical protein
MPFLEHLYNSHQFLIISSIVTFYRDILLSEEYNRVKDTIFIILRDNTAKYIVGGIHFNDQPGI